MIFSLHSARAAPGRLNLVAPAAATLWTTFEMDQLPGPDANPPTPALPLNLSLLLTVISLPAATIALVTSNVWLYQHARSLRHPIQRSWTGVRWPEDALQFFLLVWVLTLIASCVATFRVRNKILKYLTGLLVAAALVAIVVNAFFFIAEALNF